MKAVSAPRLSVVAGLDVVEATARAEARQTAELAQIHEAVCLARRRNLRCSTCADLAERSERADALARRAAVRP